MMNMNMDRANEKLTSSSLSNVFGAFLGIALGLAVSGTLLYTLVRVLEFFWSM